MIPNYSAQLRRPSRFLVFLLLVVAGGSTFAQKNLPPPLAFRHYTVTDGLSHNAAWNFVWDSNGLMWIATEDGVNKFDAYDFTPYHYYQPDSSHTATFPTFALAKDLRGVVWAGTWGGGVYQYDVEQDHFRKFELPDGQASKALYINDLYCDRRGNIWIGTDKEGAYRYEPSTGKFTHYRHQASDRSGLCSNRVMAITEDKQGRIWLGTWGGINCFDPKTEQFIRYQHDPAVSTSLSSNNTYSILFDSQERLWVGTWKNGLNRLRDDQTGFVRYRHQPTDSRSLSNDQVWVIVEDSAHTLWVGTDNGLCRYDESQDNFYVYKNDPVDPGSLPSNSIKALYCDPDGGLWVGAYNGGVSLFDRSMVRMGHRYATSDNSLSYNNVSAFAETSDGFVVIGTDGGGVDLLSPQGRFANFRHQPERNTSLSSDQIKSIFVDRQQRIWVGFWEGGLDRFQRENQTFVHYNSDAPRQSSWLTNNSVTDIDQDRSGMLWLGTFGGGVHRFDPETEIFTSYQPTRSDSTDRFVWCILVDRDDLVWAGTSNGSLIKVDREKNLFSTFPIRGTSGFGHAINVLFEDSDGQLWVGTEGGGLFLVDKVNRSTRNFTVDQGLPDNYINAIEEDKDGNLWLSTNQEIARFNRDTYTVTHYSHLATAQRLQFNNRASYSLSTNELLFGGINGYNRFHPDSLNYLPPPVPIVFTEFEVFNQPIIRDSSESILSGNINRPDTITLSYRESVISLSYAALNYARPEQTRYRYRLKGFVDERWQDAGDKRRVTYTNLEPGEYTFEVTTQPVADRSPTVARAYLIVVPPWWNTWYFRVLAAVVTAGLLFLIYHLRLLSIRKANVRLERQVRERTLKMHEINYALNEKNLVIQEQKEEIESQTEELVEANEKLEERVSQRTEELKKSNEELDNFVYRVSHDVRAPLSSILGLIELVKLEPDDTNKLLYWEMAAQSVHKLDGFVKDILNYSRNSRTPVATEAVDFAQLVADVFSELQYMKGSQDIRLTEEYQIKSTHYNDRRRLQVIFQNIISNAIKYRNPWVATSWIRVHVVSDQTNAVVTIQDNGIGIDKDQLPKVFTMFYRANERSDGSGIGLYIVKEAVEKLGGSIHLDSSINEGTTFTLELPNRSP